jgi:uncharacterized membrane protein YhhN
MSRLLLLISVVASAIYASSFVLGPFSGMWAVKAFAVALLAVWARRYRLLAIGLLLGSIGDALLDLDPKYFVAGLVAFLVGHAVYALCFWRSGRGTPGPIPQITVLLFAGVFIAWLWPSLGAMRIPAACYFAAITMMALASLRVGGWVAIGALLFLASDAMLATDRFRLEIPLRDWLVWSTYYCGQLGIALGFVRSQSVTVVAPEIHSGPAAGR